MQLSNSFTIARPVKEVYQAFLRVEEVATCMPGSTLLGQPEPGRYEGEVKVKVGPLGVNYTGQLVVLDADDEAHRLTMRAKGREKRGAGNADAHIVANLSESDGSTLVQIDTELNIRGKVAQFGRGAIGEVTDGIMQTFARNVEQMLRDGGVPTPSSTAGDASGTGTNSRPAVAPAISASEPAPGGVREPVSGQTFTPTSTGPAASELDAWALIVRPMLQRHGGSIATVACSAVAAWLGARAGARRACRH